MKKKIFPLFLLLAALLLSGCMSRTVYDMYSLPRRSEEYSDLEAAMEKVMGQEMVFSAPQSGMNRQAVQMADLTGDGREEYLVFVKGTGEKPMKILVFGQNDQEKAELVQIIEGTGAAFEQVDYVDMDGQPGLELIVSRQVSDQVPKSVSVYGYREQELRQLLNVSCSRFLTSDLNRDGQPELFVIQPGTEDQTNAMAMLYSLHNGTLERSMEAKLSQRAENILRINPNMLESGEPAVYVASTVAENTIITDVFALRDGNFTNISLSSEAGTSVKTLRNYYVYGSDVDRDGVLELPSLIGMKPVTEDGRGENQYLIRWFSLNLEGTERDKFYTFHNYQGGWYLRLDSLWAHRAAVEQAGNTYTVHIWDEDFTAAVPVYTVYALTGSDRETQAAEDGRFALLRTDSVIYAARMEPTAADYGITRESLAQSFRLIYEDWMPGENMR